ncbi:hypothetical protein EC957_002830 [Mortierella hygrophila]|uniref:F-box domain-containing protein n=1 Tax=Mortierella hygrophila TaxID=979708 RepID=A0A9P6FGU2_9FUNG|nr:hypothetical protein EC957_002830 [Mortierella hygrophila]
MDTKNDDGNMSALAAQLEKADIIMDDPNIIDIQGGSTVPIRNNSSSSSSTLLYAINDKMRATAATTSPSTTTDEEDDDGIEFTLPPEITMTVFGHLSIQNLLVCQRVSRHFRVFARTVMLDKLGGQAMGCQRHQCPQCRRNQQRPFLQRSSGGSSTSGGGGGGGGGAGQHGSSGLPPLPYHHLINNPNTLLPTTVSPVSHHNSYLQLQDPPLHQLHHHLYQHQSTEDRSQHHHQTDLHIHHQSHSYHDQPSRPVSTSQQLDSIAYNRQYHMPSSTPQYHHAASYVAPGNIALFLFPYNDHTPTSWQDRQSVHLVCTGIDRPKEQLVFSPIYPEVGDCLKFNTNSWNLPSTFAASGSLGDGFATSFSTSSVLSDGQDARTLNNNVYINDPRSTNRFATTGATTAGPETTYSTRLDLFDYATGRPRFPGPGQASTDSLNSTSYSFANQFNRPHSRTPSLASISSSSSSSSFSSTPSSPPRQSQSSPTSSWANVGGNGGEHYSVIGIKHGDWPEDRQAAGRWWGGGLHSSMTQESMVYMPWVGASSAFDFHQGSSFSHSSNGRTLNNSNLTLDAKMENVSPASSKYGRSVDEGCTKIHKHHMYLPSTRAHNPPGHHHRFMCLHHDQLMTDIAAASSSSSSSDSKSKNTTGARATKTPLTTAGSTHLEVDYSARVTESKRCLFCLSTPCKASLEIQVKFDQLRVSLDWILSGFGPDQTMATSSAPRSNGGSAIADALAMGSVRQGQVPS